MIEARLIHNINKYSLFLLVFSVTFENWDPFSLVGTLSVTKIASILYIITWVPLLKKNFNIQPLKKYIIPLLLFTIMGIFSTAINNIHANSILDVVNIRVVQLILLMFLITAHFYFDKSLVVKSQSIYVASVVVMYLLVAFGVGVEYEAGRLLLFGENPNLIGMKAVTALLLVLSNLFYNKFTIRKLFFTIVLVFMFLSLITVSASRGALFSVFIGVFVLMLFLKINIGKKLLLSFLGIGFSLMFLTYTLENNAGFKKRILNTVEKGDTGRNDLWESAGEIIQDNLFFGVGFPGALPEMFKYSGRYMDPHNTFIYLWMTTGVFGFFFFMLFIIILAMNLNLSFKKTEKVIYIMIFIIVLFNMSKAGGGLGKIFFWFFFAVLIGSTFIEQNLIGHNSIDHNLKNK